MTTFSKVIAMDNVDVALLQLGGTGEAVCQARKVLIIILFLITVIVIIVIIIIIFTRPWPAFGRRA